MSTRNALRPLAPLLHLMACLVAGAALASGGPDAPEDLPIDARGRAELIDIASTRLEHQYIWPERSAAIEKAWRQHLKKGDYDALNTCTAFADALKAHMQEVGRDKHLSIRCSPKALKVWPEPTQLPEPPRELSTAQRERARKDNYGVQRAERLAGNVGIIRLSWMPNPEFGGEAAAAAMRMVENTDALILDLRDNGGGYPSVGALYTGWLVPGERLLFTMDWAAFHTQVQVRTPAFLPVPHYAGKEVYILTSHDTISAGEHLAYELQALGRARVVGELTAGAANPTVTLPIHEHYFLSTPMGKAISATTGTSFDGVGVKPDVAVPADDALRTAHLLALQSMAGRIQDEVQLAEIREALGQLQAPKAPSASAP